MAWLGVRYYLSETGMGSGWRGTGSDTTIEVGRLPDHEEPVEHVLELAIDGPCTLQQKAASPGDPEALDHL
jgi:hypothetical protein